MSGLKKDEFKLKIQTKSTTANEKLVVNFKRKGCKFLVFNRTGGVIYANFTDEVSEEDGLLIESGYYGVLVENEDRNGRCKYTDTISILPTSNSINGLRIQMVDYK